MTFLLFLLTGLSASASGPTGNLEPWKGRYETVNCIQCPDHVIEGGENLKNFIKFDLGFGTIDPEHLLQCAQTNMWIGMDFTIQSDDKNATNSVGNSTGQCDWNATYGESLNATNDVFTYQVNGSSEKMLLMITKTGTNQYLFHQVVN